MLPTTFTRKFAITTATVFAALVGSVGAAKADIQDFYVRNFGKTYVYYIYVSPSYSDSWEEDVLGRDVLPPNTDLFIEMHGFGNHCYFDVKIEDELGRSQEYWDVDLCRVLYVDYQ